MKAIIKKFINTLIPADFKYQQIERYFLRKKFSNLSLYEYLTKIKLIRNYSTLSPILSYAKQFKSIIKKESIDTSMSYIYPYESNIFRLKWNGVSGLVSITVDFGKVINSNIREIKEEILKLPESDFKQSELSILESIESLAIKINKSLQKNHDGRKVELAVYFPDLLYRRPQSLDEAIQKILFYNALFWQMQHKHIGLGRLDKILQPYYENDLQVGKINRDKAKSMLVDFCNILHKDSLQKSASLKGDTGQYILLGGSTKDIAVIENDITELFLEIFAEKPYADPKLILRVNEHTSDKIWELAIKALAAGSGSPLIMNETPVMNSMKEFGYYQEDVYEVGTSACWEPLIIGKSFDQNNPFQSACAVEPVTSLIKSGKSFQDFEDFKHKYFQLLSKEIVSVVNKDIKFDVSPLFSLFFDNCISEGKDFARGGAIYAHHGIQIIALPNAVNALMNVKKHVFDNKTLTLEQLASALTSDFVGFEDIRNLLLSGEDKFGNTNSDIVAITNEIMQVSSDAVSGILFNGEKLKVGFSSPNYINMMNKIGSSADGRKIGEPLAVHISPTSSNIDISEILDFASKLDYSGNRINGNVVDFIIPPSYLKSTDKLCSIIKDACARGIYELQLNVLDKTTLIDAKAHPEKYPNLIVRVWGFSAYFNDLPESYKDNLIARASLYEAN